MYRKRKLIIQLICVLVVLFLGGAYIKDKNHSFNHGTSNVNSSNIISNGTASKGNAYKNNEEKLNVQIQNQLTSEQAVQIIGKYAKNKYKDAKYSYDHTEEKSGIKYYVVRVYNDMGDHISTLGWFYINVDTGKTFELDVVTGDLKELN